MLDQTLTLDPWTALSSWNDQMVCPSFNVILAPNSFWQNLRCKQDYKQTMICKRFTEIRVYLAFSWSESLGGDPDVDQQFSAVCYIFGTEMQSQLGYPIGLISDSIGGTNIQAWSTPEVIKKCLNSS